MQEDLTSHAGALDSRTARLRRTFDEGFEAPPRAEPESTLDVLTVSVGDDLLAVRVEDVAHVQARPVIVGMPDMPHACLGVAGQRGKLVAVFDLARLLGRPQTSGAGVLLVARADPSVGFAVPAIDRYRRVPRSALAEPTEADGHFLGTLPVVGERRAALVSLEALLATLDPTQRSTTP